jgi:hypothetical protein
VEELAPLEVTNPTSPNDVGAGEGSGRGGVTLEEQMGAGKDV